MYSQQQVRAGQGDPHPRGQRSPGTTNGHSNRSGRLTFFYKKKNIVYFYKIIFCIKTNIFLTKYYVSSLLSPTVHNYGSNIIYLHWLIKLII